MFSKNIIALISNKIQYFLYFVQKNHVTYFTVMKEPAFSYLGSMWASTPTNCAPIVLYEVSIFVLIVGCDAHIAPKKFNEIAFGADCALYFYFATTSSASVAPRKEATSFY